MTVMQHPRVLVVGGGAIGGYLAARMHEKGVSVAVLTGPRRSELITLQGLRITSPFGRFRRPVSALVAAQIKPEYDVVILGCRSHLVADAIEQVKPALTPATIVLSLADGGPDTERLRREFPVNPVLKGIFEGRVRMDVDGYIYHRPAEAHVIIGERQNGDHVATRLAELLTGRGLIGQVTGNLQHLAWARSIYLTSAIGTSVLTNRPLRDALRFHPGKTHFDHMLAAGRRIATAASIPISKSLTWPYLHAFLLEASSVDAPHRVTDPGGAGLEAVFLLREMVEHAESLGVRANSLKIALDAVAKLRAPRSIRRDVLHSAIPIEV